LWREDIRLGKVEEELDDSTRIPLLARLVRYKIDGKDVSDDFVVSECMGHTLVTISLLHLPG